MNYDIILYAIVLAVGAIYIYFENKMITKGVEKIKRNRKDKH